MIYTIKCRRGHCGSQYASEESEGDCHGRAQARGWTKDADGAKGWLCPFDAPKEAAKPAAPETMCSFPLCINFAKTKDAELLEQAGWHADVDSAHRWYCPTCWKTTQPEPYPGVKCATPDCVAYCPTTNAVLAVRLGWSAYSNDTIGSNTFLCPTCTAKPLAAPEFSIDQVKEIAREACGEMLVGMVERAIEIGKKSPSFPVAPDPLECLEQAIPQLKPRPAEATAGPASVTKEDEEMPF